MYIDINNYTQLPAVVCIKGSGVIKPYGISASEYSANM